MSSNGGHHGHSHSHGSHGHSHGSHEAEGHEDHGHEDEEAKVASSSNPTSAADAGDFDEVPLESGEANADSPHCCGPQCGHPAVRHDGHVGYLKDGVLHCQLLTIDGRATTQIHDVSLLKSSSSDCPGCEGEDLGPFGGSVESKHNATRLKHGDGLAYLVGDTLYDEHGQHHGHLDFVEGEELTQLLKPKSPNMRRRFQLKGSRPNIISQLSAERQLPPDQRELLCCGKKKKKPNAVCRDCCVPKTGCCAVAMKQGNAGRFIAMMVLTGGYFLVELIVGYIIQSLSLQADAYHMLSDIIALAIGFAASVLSTLPSSKRFTFGFVNMEVVGALINATFLLSTCMQITLEATARFAPSELDEIAETLGEEGELLLIVACIGLAINIAGLFIFGHGHSHGGDDHGHSHGGGHGHAHGHGSDGDSDSSSDEDEVEDGHHGHGHSHGQKHQVADTHEHGHSHSNGHSHGHDHGEAHAHGDGGDHGHGHGGHGHAHDDGDCDHDGHDDHDDHGAPKGKCVNCFSKNGNMNVQAVLLHVLGDALGSIGVIISALVIMFAGDDPRRCYIDPVMSLVIVIIILVGTIPLFKRTVRLLLHSAPGGLNVSKVGRKITKINGVVDVHDFHAWSLTNSKKVASLHVVMYDDVSFPAICDQVKLLLHKAGIHATTVQPEFVARNVVCPTREGKEYSDMCNEPICGTDCMDGQCCKTTVEEELVAVATEEGGL